MDPEAIEKLLEEGEAAAKAHDAKIKREADGIKQEEDFIKLESEPHQELNGIQESDGKSRDPRRHGRNDRESKNRYSAEREENDQRRSRKSRDLGEDEDMKDASDKGSANGSVRSRRRSRSPDSDRRRRSSRDRDYRSPRDDRNGDYYVGGGRPSAGRDDDRYRPDRDGDSARRRDDRDRSPRRDRDRRDRRRPSPDRPRKAKTPEPTDDERDRRTVFVQQLAARLRTKELKQFFEQVGGVVDAQIVKDRVSGRSKGVGYVEFRDEESVQKAIQLTGQKLLGIPIIAQLTEAEKNRQAKSEGTATQSNGIPFHRLYVGNIHFSITEEDLKNIFDPFGELEFVQLQKEEQGRSKGYGFVQFNDPTQAKEALEKMNGFELAGRPIRVGLGNDKFTPESTQSLLQRFGSQAQQAQFQGSSFSGSGGRGAHAGGNNNFDRANKEDQNKGTGASALDDADVGGTNFNRYDLMNKLARVQEPEPKAAPKAQQRNAPVREPDPTRCLQLKNMFDQTQETEANWQQELQEDVKTECNNAYGQVVHIGLSLESEKGEIYVKFDRVEGGKNAYRGLNGRYFGGQMIAAAYVVEAVYNATFPAASKV